MKTYIPNDMSPYDKVKFTWARYVIMAMINYPIIRCKWFFKIFRNTTTHICYKDNKVVKKVTVNFFMWWIDPHSFSYIKI
jgi:hypothetical protein